MTTALGLALLASNPSMTTGVSIRQFRITINLAESFTQSAFPMESETEIVNRIVSTIHLLNRSSFTPYAGSRLVPSIDRIRVWDSRFSYNAFAGQEYSYSAVHEFNHSLTISTHGLTAWDVGVTLLACLNS